MKPSQYKDVWIAAALYESYVGRWSRSVASVLSPKYEVFCCDQNGPPARREEGAYLNRYVTDEQRSRRPIFIATLWAGASWLFFRVARSTRMTQIWALRSRLEKQPTDLRQNTSYFGDRTLELYAARSSRNASPRCTKRSEGNIDSSEKRFVASSAALPQSQVPKRAAS
jgi:hypothetical protein